MATEWIDVVDTAVKIGLGALISGWATHRVSQLKHTKEAEKESKSVHREMVLVAVEKSDEYFQYMSEYFSRLDGLRQSLDQAGTFNQKLWKKAFDYLEVVENNLTTARNCVFVAQSRLKLLGMSEAIEALHDVRKLEQDLRSFYLNRDQKLELPTDEFLCNWASNFTENKNKFHNSVSTQFLGKCC